MTSSRFELISKCLGAETLEKINKSKILVVGAGGIGCELLKNLVMMGFNYIEVIDLDTIDVSNLNRQFLFRKKHVGSSKSQIARESVLNFNSEPTIIAHHGNIKEQKFGVTFFEKFTLVINALDNMDARRHVNRLCLAAKKPLIEAGTSGYLGQAYVIKGGETECYECEQKPTQKKYPICTIRSTPDKPIHCIVWAKEFFKLLFGVPQDSALWESDEIAGNSEHNQANEDDIQNVGESVYIDTIMKHPVSQSDVNGILNYAVTVFKVLFNDEIEKKLSMNKYEKAKFRPKAIVIENVLNTSHINTTHIDLSLSDHIVPTIEENVKFLLKTIVNIWQTRRSEIGTASFDKDIETDVDFVTAASNLRSSVFGIPMQSRFKVKEMAGNIIPAIATTNAIVAGLQVMEAVKIIKGLDISTACKYTYCVTQKTRKGLLLLPTSLQPPNKKCAVCSKAQLSISLDTQSFTLKDFISKVIKGGLGFNEPTISLGEDTTIWEEGDGADDFSELSDMLLKDLPGGGVRDEAIILIDDFSQCLEVQIIIKHVDKNCFDKKKYPELFSLTGDIPVGVDESETSAPTTDVATSSSITAPSNGNTGATAVNDECEIISLDDDDTAMANSNVLSESSVTANKESLSSASKRGRSSDVNIDNECSKAKKQKLVEDKELNNDNNNNGDYEIIQIL